MGDNTRRMFLSAAAFALTVAVISTYLFFYQRTTVLSEQIKQSQELQQYQIEEYAITRYNNSLIYGSQVISFLKNNETRFQKVLLEGTDITGIQSFHDSTSPAYINMNAVYLLRMEEDANGVITTLKITLSNTP